MRVSRKGQERIEDLVARISRDVRTIAVNRALKDGREFADVHDINCAYEALLTEIVGEFRISGER